MEESLEDLIFSHTADDGKSERAFKVTPPLRKNNGCESPDHAATIIVCDVGDYVGEATTHSNRSRNSGELKGQLCENIEGQLNSVLSY